MDGISISFTGSNAEIVNDPVLGASNRVLRFQNPGTITSFAASFPVPEIADGEHGTLHFRFLVPDQNHDISFGLSDVAQPTAFGDFEVQLQSSANSGTLQVRNAGTVQTAVAISPGIRHTVIAHIDNTTDRWNLYLTDSGAPALVKSNIVFRNGTASALRSFFIRSNTTGGANISPIYLDDIRIDPGHANLTDPLARDWEIVEHFDGPDPLEAWE